MKTRLLFILLLLIPSFSWAVVSGVDDINPNINAEDQEAIDTAITTYYQAPSVDKVNTVLDIMNNTDLLRKKTAWPPIVGFLTVVFANNKNHVMDWMSRNDYNTHAQNVFISALMHAKLRESAVLFAQAHQWKKPNVERLRFTTDNVDLANLPIILPGHIDTLWGAFFGSGDLVYVNEIINVLFMTTVPHSDEISAPPGYDVLGENKKLAENTLRQYALTDKRVHEAISIRMHEENDKTKKKILKQLLS